MNHDDLEDDLRPEYDFDFSESIRGKHDQQYKQSTNVVVLDPDVAAASHNSAAVNTALRSMPRFVAEAQPSEPIPLARVMRETQEGKVD
jgi:hypothetical protein